MITYKRKIKRYCPTQEHNVEIEIRHHHDGQISEKCLDNYCERVGCRVCRKTILVPARIIKQRDSQSL